ncbi:hypothetical protein VaNZ11_003801 [Volvox africanus]|uniref:Guanylyl and adenylyl cyclase family member n=1 Tax=Volvox africanus TaxID=51714 RepID=A0ABQ5RW59_9CHLO|nr:hypothetical protein VaNZ11_003801 [Volvox africanus]
MATAASQAEHVLEPRTNSIKQLLENDRPPGSPISRCSAPTAFSLLLGDVHQVDGGVVSAVRASIEQSARLLPLRQTILGNNGGLLQFECEDEESSVHKNGGAQENGSWLGSGLPVRAKCNEGGNVIQESSREEPSSQPQLKMGDSVVLDISERAALSVRPVCSALPAAPAGSKPQREDRFWKNFTQQLRQQQKIYIEVAMRKWWILAIPLLLCLLLVALGVFGVVYASLRYMEQLRDYARGALASTAISTVAGQLEIATFAVMTLSAYLTQHPNCTELDQSYNSLGNVIFQWDAKQAVYQLQAMPAAVVKYVHPYPDSDLARQLIGRDILELPQYREDTIKQIKTRDQRLLLGPYNLVEGFKAMFVTFAVFLPAPDPMYDWGCGVQPYKCPPDTCWLPDPASGGYLKLWGMATSIVRLDALKEGFGFQKYEEQGYHFRLRQLHDEINKEAIIDASSEKPKDPVTLTLRKYNLEWEFEVAPASGWAPSWRDPCIAAVVVGSVVVSALVLWLMLTRERHNLLLRAMLPRKVIQQLQKGRRTVVEEYHDPVTILFTDIVSYTEVASQLTPLQVVRLLNELYTEFDALTDKHGVYKVETIGDAFMCVSGCPMREDPVKAARRMAGMAQDMIALVERFVSRVSGEEMKVQIRIGLHSGPVVAGVIGQRMPRYCLFGDTVNTASRMESNSAPMSINVSCATAELLRAGGAVVVPFSAHSTAPCIPCAKSLVAQSITERNSRNPFGVAEPLRRVPSLLPSMPRPMPLPSPSPSPPLRRRSTQEDCVPQPQPQPQPEPQYAPEHHKHYQTCSSYPRGHEHLLRDAPEKLGCENGCDGSSGSSGSSGVVPKSLILYSRGTVHIKGKGPMVCYWLGRSP